MTYDLDLLDFNAIRRVLTGMASTVYGREAAKDIEPAPEKRIAELMQASISSARALIDSGQPIPLEDLQSIRAALKQAASEGAALNTTALANIKHTLLVGHALESFVAANPDVYPYDRNQLIPCDELLQTLDRCLEGVSSLSHNASELLAKLHGEYAEVKQEATDVLTKLQRDKSIREYLAESKNVYWQGDRAVLVVRNEYTDKVKGVRRGNKYGSLDQLVEPISAVGINNRIEKLGGEISGEQQRILREITDEVRGVIQPLNLLLDAITWIDLALAGARLSEMMNGHAPKLVDDPGVCLKQAYHPVLLIQFLNGQISRPVPLSLTLSAEQQFLLITGPNTGGKTVALKTLGLLVCMSLCGLHIPAEEDCEIGWYTAVMVDMGDRQSLYHQLSTFAGHVEMLKRILSVADSQSLLLFDELGTGTDPDEGAALAMAVMDEFIQRRSQGILNTHLSPLKDYGEKQKAVINASMRFDYETLKPTYELQLGVSGKSLGLTVAEQNGLADNIVENARGYFKKISADQNFE